jgi:hypothetical protein
MVFDQEKYIESVKGILMAYIRNLLPEHKVITAFPDVEGTSLDLSVPLVYVEFERESNVERRRGKWVGDDSYQRRVTVVYSIQVFTSGDGKGVLARDRTIQKLKVDIPRNERVFAGQGLRKVDMRFMGSYRLRERIHLARMEFFTQVTMTTIM